MKFKDILNDKVVYEENVGDEYYWDYRIIIEHKGKYCLIEYDDSCSGYIEFNVESVSKEFIYDFFRKYDENWEKHLVKLNMESTKKLKDIIDFEYNKEVLEEEIFLLDYKDLKKYARKWLGDE